MKCRLEQVGPQLFRLVVVSTARDEVTRRKISAAMKARHAERKAERAKRAAAMAKERADGAYEEWLKEKEKSNDTGI
jgi:hypothetical protein